MTTDAEKQRLAALAKARAELDTAVRELCQPRRIPMTVAGKLVVGEVPSWLDQLRESRASANNAKAAGAGSGSPSPANVGALDTLRRVEAGARQLHARVLSRSDRSAEHHLRGIVAEVARWESPEQVGAVAAAVTDLLAAIQQVLDPRGLVPVEELCPHCGRRMVLRWDASAGERRQVSALVLDVEAGTVSCRGCTSCWPAAFAGALIEQRKAELARAAAIKEANDRAWRVHAYYQQLARKGETS